MGEYVSGLTGVGIGAVITALGVLAVRWFRARGGYARDLADAEVVTSAEEHKQHMENDENNQKRENIVVRELKALVESLKIERSEDRKEINALREEINIIAMESALCKAGRAQADERIASLEEALDAAKIPHRKWKPDEVGHLKIHRPRDPQERS